MVILGIDPGTASIGYGVLKVTSPGKIRCLDCGLIKTDPQVSFPKRLEKISKDFDLFLKKYQPSLVSIESVFFFKNLKTFIPVSRATGVIILGAAKRKIPIVEFTPLQVKSKIAEYGRAEKRDVQRKIRKILNYKGRFEQDDVADALGVAVCAALSLRP